MAFEIPQNLKYEEKIVFGLTLKQFAWIALFGILAAIVYLKTGLDFYLKAVISLVLAGLGLGFAFLDLFGHLKTLNAYRGSIRQAGYLDSKLESFVDAKSIDQDTIFLKDGSARAILQVVPFHFNMLSPPEQHAIISAYRDFLNSLDFPIQIVMRTINLSLTEYLAVLQKKVENAKKQTLQAQFESFKNFIQKFISEKKVKNRVFYLIVPVSGPNKIPFMKKQTSEHEALKNQLDIRIKICQDKLKRCNLLTKRLDSQELVSLTANFFEGFIQAQNEYFSTITTIKEGEKNEQENKRIWFNPNGERIEPTIIRNR